jgi:hypothetical protein
MLEIFPGSSQQRMFHRTSPGPRYADSRRPAVAICPAKAESVPPLAASDSPGDGSWVGLEMNAASLFPTS